MHVVLLFFFFFSSRRRHTRLQGDWSSDVCSSDLLAMSPTNPNVVYVNTQFDGFFKTVDGGAHWTGGDWGGLNLVMDLNNPNVMRSEERRVGKECRSRWSPYH